MAVVPIPRAVLLGGLDTRVLVLKWGCLWGFGLQVYPGLEML